MKVRVHIIAHGGDAIFDPLIPRNRFLPFQSEHLEIEKDVDVVDLAEAYQLAVEIIKKLERKR